MPNDDTFFTKERLIGPVTTILTLIYNYTYQQASQIFKMESLPDNDIPYSKNYNRYMPVKDNSSWYNWLSIVSFCSLIFAGILYNYFFEHEEYNILIKMREINETSNENDTKITNLHCLKKEIKDTFVRLSINIDEQDSIKNFFEENPVNDVTKQAKSIQLAENFIHLYKKDANEIIDNHRNYFFSPSRYNILSKILCMISIALLGVSAYEDRYDKKPYSCLAILGVTFFAKLNWYYAIHKPALALDQHIDKLQDQYSSLFSATLRTSYQAIQRLQNELDRRNNNRAIILPPSFPTRGGLFNHLTQSIEGTASTNSLYIRR